MTGGLGDLLAMSSLTKEMNRRMEKVAESGSSLLSAGTSGRSWPLLYFQGVYL